MRILLFVFALPVLAAEPGQIRRIAGMDPAKLDELLGGDEPL